MFTVRNDQAGPGMDAAALTISIIAILIVAALAWQVWGPSRK